MPQDTLTSSSSSAAVNWFVFYNIKRQRAVSAYIIRQRLGLGAELCSERPVNIVVFVAPSLTRDDPASLFKDGRHSVDTPSTQIQKPKEKDSSRVDGLLAR
jgi:hypothetical protein